MDLFLVTILPHHHHWKSYKQRYFISNNRWMMRMYTCLITRGDRGNTCIGFGPKNTLIRETAWGMPDEGTVGS